MSYNTDPDYKKLRAILAKGLKAAGGSTSGPLEFTSSKHKSNEISDEETPEKKAKLTPGRRTPRSKINTPKKEESDSDEEYYTPNAKVSKVRGRAKNGDLNTPEATKVRGRARKVAENSDSDESENEAHQVNGHSGKGSEEKSENTNGYNAEMLRLQKKIAERNAIKNKRAKTYVTTRSAINSPVDHLDVDVIEGTPPEVININSARRRVRTPGTKGDSDEITPRGRRLKR